MVSSLWLSHLANRILFAISVLVCIFWSANLARNAAMHLIFTNHSWVSFYCSIHISMNRKHNSQLPLFLDISIRYLDHILHFLSCDIYKSSVGHCGHIQGKMHVRLVWLYQILMTSHSCRECQQQVWVTGQQSGFDLDTQLLLGPEQCKTATNHFTAGQSCIYSHAPMGLGASGQSSQFQSLHLIFRYFYFW